MEASHHPALRPRALVVARESPHGPAGPAPLDVRWVSSAYEAAAEILLEPPVALAVDLSLVGPRHARLIELARRRGVKVFAFGRVPAGMDSDQFADARLVSSGEVMQRLAQELAETEPPPTQAAAETAPEPTPAPAAPSQAVWDEPAPTAFGPGPLARPQSDEPAVAQPWSDSPPQEPQEQHPPQTSDDPPQDRQTSTGDLESSADPSPPLPSRPLDPRSLLTAEEISALLEE